MIHYLVGRKIADIDVDVEINLEKAQAEAYNLDLDHQEKVLGIMDVNEEEPVDVEEVMEVVKAAKLMTEVVSTTRVTKVSVPRKRRVVIIHDPEETTTIGTVQPKVQAKHKGKAILIEEPKSLERQAQIKLDEEIFLLIERMYPLTHFTLEQMLNNVRLQVKEESEMSLELLRLVRRQLNKGLQVEEESEMSLELLRLVKRQLNKRLTITLNMLERSIHTKGSTSDTKASKETLSVDWTGHAKDETEDYALMAFNSSNSGLNTKITSCLKVCEESYAKLKKLYDEQQEQHEDSHMNDRFAKVEGMHVVPPPMTGNYMPPKSNFGIDESKFIYGSKQSTTSESDAKTSDFNYCDSSSSEETLETVPKPVESKLKVVNEPKVRSDAPIIEEYESDSDDEYVSKASVEHEKPSCAFINTVKHVKTPKKTIQDQDIFSIACYVLNKVLVTKPQNKTPYEILTGKFEEKSNEWFLVGYSLSSKAFRHITAENKANKTTGLKEANNSAAIKSLKVKNGDEKLNEDIDSKTNEEPSLKEMNGDQKLNEDTGSKINEEPVDQADQAFLEELERLKRQEKEANDAAKTLRKTFAQNTEDLLFQTGAARASSTNFVNTASTPVNAASTPLNDASIPTNQNDSQIPALEDIYDHSRDGIFTSASYDDEGVVADFTNLESTVNVYRNKKDERGVVVRNKTRLVAQGHRQEEGIDYDEIFAPVARIEAIKIFLAFASFMGFILYQMDVKSSFLYGKIDKEVYVSQPPGFIDPKFPNKVYKVVKALYGLYQAPRAWYATLSTFLVQSGYRRGLIDNTLFIKKDKKDIMLVQVYVDDIVFGSTKKSWCDEFEALMKNMFQMNSMGELTFSWITSQAERRCTPIETKKPLVKDEKAADMDVPLYRSMIGSLMYLTASRPDIIESAFDLEAYSDSNYARENLDRKSTTGGCQFLGRRLISWECKKQTIVATLTTEAENFVLVVHKLILLGLGCAAQRCFRMVMLLTLGKKMQFGSVLGALNEGEGSGAPTEPQPTPSPTPPSDHTSDRAKDALNLEELFSICTNLSNRVLALETVKDAQAAKIIAMKARIKKLEKRCKPSISHQRAWLKSVQRLSMKKRGPMNQGRLSEETKELVSTARLEDSTVRPDVDEKAKEKGVSIKDIEDSLRPARSILTLNPLPTIDPKDKGKGVLEEPELAKKMTRRIEANALFAAKLQQEETKEYTIEERAKFLAETVDEIQGLYERQKRVIDDFKPMDLDDAVDKERVLEEPDNT
nr:putative ribonuclease H-like domain-containing protein [Tanacetum cinerariifolium]